MRLQQRPTHPFMAVTIKLCAYLHGLTQAAARRWRVTAALTRAGMLL